MGRFLQRRPGPRARLVDELATRISARRLPGSVLTGLDEDTIAPPMA